jgi:hypothetical protein
MVTPTQSRSWSTSATFTLCFSARLGRRFWPARETRGHTQVRVSLSNRPLRSGHIHTCRAHVGARAITRQSLLNMTEFVLVSTCFLCCKMPNYIPERDHRKSLESNVCLTISQNVTIASLLRACAFSFPKRDHRKSLESVCLTISQNVTIASLLRACA